MADTPSRPFTSRERAAERLALQTLVVACVVDGRVTGREKKLTQAFAELGRPVDFGPVHRLQREFIAGNGVADDAVRAI